MVSAIADVLAAYKGSSADLTRALYARLDALGPAGQVATNLLRACKTSERAKGYRRSSSRGASYDTKQWAMGNLIGLLAEHGAGLGIAWGWGPDEKTEGFPWVLYVELPAGQVSFHARARGDGPDHARGWDGVKGVSGHRACAWAASLLEGRRHAPAAPDSAVAVRSGRRAGAAPAEPGGASKRKGGKGAEALYSMSADKKPIGVSSAQDREDGPPFLVQGLLRSDPEEPALDARIEAPEQPLHALPDSPGRSRSDSSASGASPATLPESAGQADGGSLSQDAEGPGDSLPGLQHATANRRRHREAGGGDSVPRRIRGATCFSGIGAPECAAPSWDWKWSAETEAFPSAVLSVRHPGSINLGDVTAPDFIERARAFGEIDVLMGGPPCQAFSVAGLRKSLSDDRGNLTLQWARTIHAIRPVWAITENVPGWLSTDDNAFGCFLAGLVGADDALRSPLERGRWPDVGMVAGPLARACWRILDAQYAGVPQRRRRVFVVASLRDWADPCQILFEPQGVCGNLAPSREAGQRAAGTVTARAGNGSRQAGANGNLAGPTEFLPQSSRVYEQEGVGPTLQTTGKRGGHRPPMIAGTLDAASGKSRGAGTPPAMLTFQTRGSNIDIDENVTGTIGSNADRASGSGPMVAFGGNNTSGAIDQATAVRAKGGTGHGFESETFVVGAMFTLQGQTTHGVIAFDETQITHPENRSKPDDRSPQLAANARPPTIAFDCKAGGDTTFAVRDDGTTQALRGDGHGGGHAAVAVSGLRRAGAPDGAAGPTVSDLASIDAKAQGGVMTFKPPHFTRDKDGAPSESSPPLSADADKGDQDPVLMDGAAVRRLTPLECERLQGFPLIANHGTLIVCGDRQKTSAPAATKNPRSRKSVSPAGESVSKQSVSNAEVDSSASPQDCDAPVAALVRFNFEGGGAEIRNARDELLWSARSAEDAAWSLLPMPRESFARAVALITRGAERRIPDGKVASPRSTTGSLPHRSGKQRAGTSGQESAASASDAERNSNETARSITWPSGPNIQNSGSPEATLLSSAASAIAGFIPEKIRSGSSFAIRVVATEGYTNIVFRGKRAADGPRYRSLGNAMCTLEVKWILSRIEMFEGLKK